MSDKEILADALEYEIACRVAFIESEKRGLIDQIAQLKSSLDEAFKRNQSTTRELLLERERRSKAETYLQADELSAMAKAEILQEQLLDADRFTSELTKAVQQTQRELAALKLQYDALHVELEMSKESSSASYIEKLVDERMGQERMNLQERLSRSYDLIDYERSRADCLLQQNEFLKRKLEGLPEQDNLGMVLSEIQQLDRQIRRIDGNKLLSESVIYSRGVRQDVD